MRSIYLQQQKEATKNLPLVVSSSRVGLSALQGPILYGSTYKTHILKAVADDKLGIFTYLQYIFINSVYKGIRLSGHCKYDCNMVL